MRKIDYGKIKWDAATNWEFWHTPDNVQEAFNRIVAVRRFAAGTTLADFGYYEPDVVVAFNVGDVVVYHAEGSRHDGKFAVVYEISTGTDLCLKMWIKFADGETTVLRHSDIVKGNVTPAEIPDELVALARAEAGKAPDLSKYPLKRQGACMEA